MMNIHLNKYLYPSYSQLESSIHGQCLNNGPIVFINLAALKIILVHYK